jgi:hypothetical protein
MTWLAVRAHGGLVFALTVALTSLIRIEGAGQAPAATRDSGAVAAAAASWTAPRTPWGDPDLQGDFTNKSEQGTPFERPKEFEGRRLEDVNGKELENILRERQQRVIDNARPPGSDNTPHGPVHWSDRYEVVKGGQAWTVVDPPDGKIPPLTPAARERTAARAAANAAARRGPADSWVERGLYERCLTRGLPGSMMPAIYGNSYRIVQGPGVVAITYEMVHETRVIPLDGRPHADASIRGYMGVAVGRWEGDTLVVETTNFREESTYRNANAATLRLTERFTRVAPDKVRWAVTVEDPQTWTRPWTFALPLTMNDDEPVFEYACHEGNYGLLNILRGARAEEQAASGGAPSR